jgi:bifunctional UDP-N-acetylglucosamine pyrophosphorylase/glucosamine-1-phosphate N-acetyltransferase
MDSIVPRHAVILAAGESTRTRPLTLYRPKPLITLLDRPLLAHILDELVGLVERATLVVGYRADMVEAFFGTSYRGIELRYAHQQQVNGTAGALLAVGKIDEPFFLLYGDNLIAREDIVGVTHGRYAVAGLLVEDARAFGLLQIEDGRVRAIIEKPAHPPANALANPGIYRFDSAVFPLLEQITPSPRGELELTDLIAAIAATESIVPHRCTGYWVPVGNPWEALSAAQFLVASRTPEQIFIHPTAHVDPSAQIIGPCVIGPQALVGAAATVVASVLSAGASVDAGAAVHSSWLDDGASVGAGALLAARTFEELRPTAETRGRLQRTQLITRGAILGRGVRVAVGAQIEPGTTIVAPYADLPDRT